MDEWHRIAINHARALVGYVGVDHEVQKDHCMFARALKGDQRKFTTMWGSVGSAAGPCQGSSNAHCGATFLPDAVDQVPYLPPGHAPCSATQGSEGVLGGPKTNIPWSLKWSRGLCNTFTRKTPCDPDNTGPAPPPLPMASSASTGGGAATTAVIVTSIAALCCLVVVVLPPALAAAIFVALLVRRRTSLDGGGSGGGGGGEREDETQPSAGEEALPSYEMAAASRNFVL